MPDAFTSIEVPSKRFLGTGDSLRSRSIEGDLRRADANVLALLSNSQIKRQAFLPGADTVRLGAKRTAILRRSPLMPAGGISGTELGRPDVALAKTLDKGRTGDTPDRMR